MPNYKVDMAEVLAFEEETKQLMAMLDEQIGDVKASIDQIKQMDSFQGQAADDAKAYFEVMHRNLLTAFQGVFSQLEANITKHVRDFQEEIDADPHAIIEAGYIDDQKEMIEDRHDQFNQLTEKIESIINEVSDITTSQAPSTSRMDEDEHASVQVWKKLTNKLDGFSTSYRSDEEQIESTLVEIKRFMNRRVQIGAPDSDKDFADFLPKMREHLFEARENDSFNHVLLSYEDRTFQKKPAYDFSEYDKTRANNYWVLSKNGITDQEAAKATVAYNEALKNGEIQLEGPEPDVDIGVEQILAAKDGYDYFTGKEISKIQSATIIVGVVSSGFSWRGSRRFSLSKMQVSKIKNNVKTTRNSVNGKINNKATVTKGTGEVSKEISDIHHVKEAKDIIAERTKGLNLKEHPTTTKQMSSAKMKELKDKIDNRTITKQEYADYIWNKKFAKRRDKGVKEFWYQEQQRLLNNEPLTRDWSQEQLKDILAGKTPKFDGKPIAGHHSYSVSKYPHLADRGEIIYPATFNEHLKGWHGGNWRNSIPGEPIIPIKDF
ncbi:T7SS effector LXG polymorphic toxin [Paraliobacillus ryukyuensis]|uniref:T7SS effector LXG polymorphic toxin n=1 Tax=Paraliobacillus ryukyuensis TaxID=200904 RepID=UPI0009A59D6E|nr:T7SS effector LXG polymorphic toxin [Paraliobacillus ryukyuensis]